MPKREPTPPPADSEPYYLTILNPYPLNANMAVAGDLQKLALWLAAATEDTAALLAIFHKPSSPRLVILELSRNYRDIRRLLGQHFWGGPKGFLNMPSPSEKENYSAIFFCHYTTARNVEKHGWKREWFEDTHFPKKVVVNKPVPTTSAPKPERSIFKDPYPATTYLQVPATDPTALEFCRHLPLELFPEVGSNKNKLSEAPVGSKTWAVKKDQRPPAANQSQSPAAKSGPSTPSVPGVAAALSTLDVAQELQEPQEPQDLWAVSTQPESGVIPWMSDLALASLHGESELDQGVCPFHGVTCKKMCSWRTDYDKKRGPKSEGPSNIKNYNRTSRGGKNDKGRPRVNITRSSEGSANPSFTESTNISPVVASPTTAGREVPTVKRAPPPPPGLTWSGVVSPVKQTASEALPSAVPAGVGGGVPNGPVRGAPAWSLRGRGRGRAV